ncbi:DUF547 domain-containing protein [Erythrobacter sp. MTPC3]|uniref:DUF547 domain-containing protein n=1 Tax=Erythrobacter sp. MTPC3 TaxID=3056564 RepID=UPI0036F3887E
MKPGFIALALAGSMMAAPISAETASSASFQTGAVNDAVKDNLERFAPADVRGDHQIDYEHWDEALAWMVIPMGPSIRQTAGRVEADLGSRMITGHDSRFRLEGNRVAFSFLTPEIVQALSEYRADLERVGSTLDITSIPRNEQLAFWLNLHNVAVIEALAYEYPLRQPADRTFGAEAAPLDDAKLVTVAGVALSPRDIRERIVYNNWRDPKVMYGFWRGAIGGPSIQRIAFDGANVDALLALSAEEFVNSLRGVEKRGDTLQVSPIYQEASGYYFSDDDALRAHLEKYAGEDVSKLLGKTSQTDYKSFEQDLADLAKGHAHSNIDFLSSIDCRGQSCAFEPQGGSPVRTNANLAIQRLMKERGEKLRRAYKAGIRSGMVIYGDGKYSESDVPAEVE